MKQNDPVKPQHYLKYIIEPIAYIISQRYNFCGGNIIKYVVRFKDKNGIEDLNKAEYYCNQLIERHNDRISCEEFCSKNNFDDITRQIITNLETYKITNNKEHLQNVLDGIKKQKSIFSSTYDNK